MDTDRARTDGLLQGGLWATAGLWAMGWVWWAQDIAGMAPCELCFWERWPYRALILLGLAWMIAGACGLRVGRAMAVLITLTLLAAVGIAGLHVGVEQGWWPSPLPACAAPHFSGGTMAQRLAAMPLRPAKPCDSPNRLLGWLPVSMAMLDFIYAVVLLTSAWLIVPPVLRSLRRPR
ncbi:disulfide bond formation protein B [Lichenicola sp.]|uniref:disulfide bond formation protein B n=1 Tax=Lichenicola sp. TaxID=2804529 RepID=UPI003B0015AF